MPIFDITIKGSVDGDDPELSYLNKGRTRFATADDVLKYLAEFMAEELAFETINIEVVQVEDQSVGTPKAAKE